MKKLAILRDTLDVKCPFGLEIPYGCKCAGHTVEQMTPTDDDRLSKSNMELLLVNSVGEKCLYANEIFEDKEMVECSYDNEQLDDRGLNPSTFYQRVFNDAPYTGLTSIPISYYNDNRDVGNGYYGITTVQAKKK